MDKKYKKKDFTTPEGYFEDFTEKLLSKVAREDSNIPKKDGFSVPDGYFENLNEKLLSEAKQKETKVISLNSRKIFYYAAAAVAAILLLIPMVTEIGTGGHTEDEFTINDLAKSEIEAYFETTDLGLTSYELAEVLPIEELEIEDFLDNTVDEENILEYLDENLDDLDELDSDFEELNLNGDE